MPPAAQNATDVLGLDEADADDVSLLGGKGASLVRMRSLGLPVPPGLVITTPVCGEYLSTGHLPEPVWDAVIEQLGRIEGELGRRLGDAERPLLLSVRSGAPVSMPGMMDTILDIGICDATLPAIAASAGAAFAWETYSRLVRMFGTTVADVPGPAFEVARLEAHADDTQSVAQAYLAAFRTHTGREFPSRPVDQLKEAVEAVFRSWRSPRAERYRTYAGISAELGTAVVIQAMVFGNLDDRSGTGVAFTRDPATGAPGLYGDFLLKAQGEDVVAGEVDPSDLDTFRRQVPAAYDGLLAAVPVLERAYSDMCDIEFTVEQGRFWLLQARRGQRTAHAAVRIALDLVDENLVDLDEAVRRIPPSSLVRIRDAVLDPNAPRTLLGRGLNASPGAATGRVALSAARAEELAEEGHPVILVRPYTSPDDIAGFIAARGIVTAHGGRTSHAAVVARGMDRPAVCGVDGLEFTEGRCTFPGGEIQEGDEIAIDGSTGEIFAGRLPLVAPRDDPRVLALLARCDSSRRIPVLAMGELPSWADAQLSAAGTARCSSPASVEDALDDPDVVRILLDLGDADDPRGLLKHVGATGELEVDLLLLVDDCWPTSVRSLPALPWSGVVAGPQGDWTARLLAAVIEPGGRP